MENPPAPLILLEAVDDERNIRRRYRIEWGQDLLGEWIVHTHWSRIGRQGQSRTEAFKAQADAERCVRRHLRRRAASSRRLGVAYLDTAVSTKPVAAKPQPVWSTKLRDYRWIDGFDGWVEDEDDAILAVHPARGKTPDRLLLHNARQSQTSLAWGLYADGKHLSGCELFISEWWANEAIRERVAQQKS